MGNKGTKPVQVLDSIKGKAYLFENSTEAFYIPYDYMVHVEFTVPNMNKDNIVSGEKYNIRITFLKFFRAGDFKITVIDDILLKKLSNNPEAWVAEKDNWLPPSPPALRTGGRRRYKKSRSIKKRRVTRKRRVYL